eukprot:gene17957-21429_t
MSSDLFGSAKGIDHTTYARTKDRYWINSFYFLKPHAAAAISVLPRANGYGRWRASINNKTMMRSINAWNLSAFTSILILEGGPLTMTMKNRRLDKLNKYFSKFGTVQDSLVIKSNEKTLKSRGFGFVTFKDPEVVSQILTMEHVIDGKAQYQTSLVDPQQLTGFDPYGNQDLYFYSNPTRIPGSSTLYPQHNIMMVPFVYQTTPTPFYPTTQTQYHHHNKYNQQSASSSQYPQQQGMYLSPPLPSEHLTNQA